MNSLNLESLILITILLGDEEHLKVDNSSTVLGLNLSSSIFLLPFVVDKLSTNSLNLSITDNYQAPKSFIFSDLGKFHGVGIYHIKPNLDKNIQLESSEFYSFDEIYFDICDFNYYISEDYVLDLVNLQVGFKYYLSLINPCKFHLIENEKSPNYIKFTRELRDNKISKVLYD